MCKIKKLTSTACMKNAAGVTGTGYMAPSEEFASWPAYQNTSDTLGDGDTVRLDGNFSFTGAGTGNGYFRTYPMLLEKGQVNYKLVGGLGSKSYEVTASFYVLGLNAEELEFGTSMKNIPGVWLFKDKNNVVHCLGSKDDPAYISEGDGTTGAAATDERGTLYTCRWITSTPQVYEGTINLTPIAP
jgi:hypothetical protein